MRYEKHTAGTEIIRSGTNCIYVYFMIRGQVKIVKNGEEIGLLNTGLFGKPESGATKRTTTITCTSLSEFFVIDYGKSTYNGTDIFSKIMSEQDTIEEFRERVESIQKLSLFKEMNIIEDLAKLAQIRYFHKSDTIVHEEKQNKLINFMLEGEISVYKKVPFIRRKNKVRPDRRCINDMAPLKDDEEQIIKCLLFAKFKENEVLPGMK